MSPAHNAEYERPAPYYDHGGITIYCGDARDLLPALTFDVAVTDPPYGIGWRRGINNARNSKAHTGIANDHDTSVRDEVLTIIGDKPAVVFGSFYAPYPANVRQLLVWHKPADAGVVGSVTGWRRDVEPVFLTGTWPARTVQWPSLLRSARGSISAVVTETGHPHTKPIDLMRTLIGRCPPGVVIDPFMGSGSTLVAAKDLGRRAIGIEIDERYCERAVRRLAQELLPLAAGDYISVASLHGGLDAPEPERRLWEQWPSG